MSTIEEVLSGEARYAVIHGDCRDLLKTIPDCSIDSVVTDPPYEIGFGGRKWDSTGIAFDVEMWSECLRVLKPGGHLCAFGASRTYHRMACAIEDAGFEIRDSIDMIYGSGAAHSKDASKAIDIHDGNMDKRPIVGSYTVSGNAGTPGAGGLAMAGQANSDAKELYRTTGATERSKKWDGFQTNLAPGKEPVVLAMKPWEGTLAATLLKYGCGALNIDATRISSQACQPPVVHVSVSQSLLDWPVDIRHDDPLRVASGVRHISSALRSYNTVCTSRDPSADDPDGTLPAVSVYGETLRLLLLANAFSYAQNSKEARDSGTNSADYPSNQTLNPKGRWPKNVVFVHDSRCIRVGSKPAKSPVINRHVGGPRFFGEAVGTEFVTDGGEPTNEAVFGCHPGCPVFKLGLQSGESGRNGSISNAGPRNNHVYGYDKNPRFDFVAYDDEGTAARYFTQLEWSEPDYEQFLYVKKPAGSEREAGCEAIEKRATTDRKPGSAAMSCPSTGAGRSVDGRHNDHLTVKPIEFVRWLIRLVTPPGGVTLSPFLGSGTDAIAAQAEGMRSIGFDFDPKHPESTRNIEIALARIAYWTEDDCRRLKAGIKGKLIKPDERQTSIFDRIKP